MTKHQKEIKIMKKEIIKKDLLKEIKRMFNMMENERKVTLLENDFHLSKHNVNNLNLNNYYKISLILCKNIKRYTYLYLENEINLEYIKQINNILKCLDLEIETCVKLMNYAELSVYRSLNGAYLDLSQISQDIERYLQNYNKKKVIIALNLLIENNLNSIKMSLVSPLNFKIISNESECMFNDMWKSALVYKGVDIIYNEEIQNDELSVRKIINKTTGGCINERIKIDKIIEMYNK